MSIYKVDHIQSEYPLLFLLLKGRPFTIETNVSSADLATRVMAGKVSFAIAQKENGFIQINVDGIKTFGEFLSVTGIQVKDTNIRKVSKYLRRAFSQCLGGAAACGSFNAKCISVEANAVNYSGAKEDLFKCVDGAMFADPRFLSEIYGQPVREHESFLGTVIIKGKFSKGKITAKILADGLDLVTYDIKNSVLFPVDLNYIHLMYKIKPSPVNLVGNAVAFRNPNGSRNEYLNLNLVKSDFDASTSKLYYSNLDMQSIINFELFEFMPKMAQSFLEGILSTLNSKDVRDLLGGYKPTIDGLDDRWLLQRALQETDVEIADYPGLLRKCRTFFASALEKLDVFHLKDEQKFQIPNKSFTRAYLTPDPSAFDLNGIYTGKGLLGVGAATINQANLYLSVADPKNCAAMLQTCGGADLDGDSVLITNNFDIIAHINGLPKLSNAKFDIVKSLSTVNNPFSSYVKDKVTLYDERAFLKLARQENQLNLGSIINKFMLLTQKARDKNDNELMEQLTPCLNSIETIIDACIGQDNSSIDEVLNRLDDLMFPISFVPDFLEGRFLNYDTGLPKFPTYQSNDSKYFSAIVDLVKAFENTFNQLQANPQIDMGLFQSTSSGMDKMAQISMFKNKEAIQGSLNAGEALDLAFAKGVEEVKAVYSTLPKEERLEFTAALVNRVYLRETPTVTKEGKNGFPDSILYTTWTKDDRLVGPGVALIELLKASGNGQIVKRCHINYDAIINGKVPVTMVGGKIMLNGNCIGTSLTSKGGECVVNKSKRKYHLLETIERQVIFKASNLIEAYLYKLPDIPLSELSNVAEINVVRESNSTYMTIGAHKIPIACKNKSTVISKDKYSVVNSSVAPSGKSVIYILR